MSTSIPILEVSGTPREMGRTHGEFFRDDIRALAATRIELLCRRHGGALRPLEAACRRISLTIEQLAPPVWEETAAIAEASGLQHWELVAAGAYSDVDDLMARSTRRVDECTIIGLDLDPAPTIIGTWDTHATATSSLVALKRSPSVGPWAVVLTTCGWPVQQAVTSAGLAFAVTNLVATTAGAGLPYIAVLPMLASCTSFDEALDLLARTRHCSARFYSLASRSRLAAIEVVPEKGIFVDHRRPFVHTNHFVFPQTRSFEGRAHALGSSETRFAAAVSMVNDLRSNATWAAALSILADDRVRQCGDGEEDRTGAVFALDPSTGTLRFFPGPPTTSDIPGNVVTMIVDLQMEA